MNSENGRSLHSEAEHLREGGSFLEAINKIKEAQVAYINDNDLLGAAEALASEVLIWRHLSEKESNGQYLILAEMAARSSVEMAKESGLKEALALPYHTLGKVLEDRKNWKEAADAQKSALDVMESNPPKRHDRPAYRNEIKIHWMADRYMSGEKEVVEELNVVLNELESDTNEPKFTKDVWLSGGYMSKATILAADNPDEARVAFVKAGEIIKANTDLKLRKEQWNKKAAGFGVAAI